MLALDALPWRRRHQAGVVGLTPRPAPTLPTASAEQEDAAHRERPDDRKRDSATSALGSARTSR